MSTTESPVEGGVTASMELRIRLRQLRRQRGLTQRELVKPLYLASHTAIVDYESGRRVPAADIIEAYERFFELPKGELQRLRSRAVADRATAEAVSALATATVGHLVPHQLPAATRHFTGRDDELAALDGMLAADGESTAVVISAIGGMGGVGKTALAVQWGHRVRRSFPDGDLYINLRGFHPAGVAMSSAEALGLLLRWLGMPGERIPPSLDERVGLYRSMLVNRRMLLVLDNASNAEQVRPLLPGTGQCVVLVTSRDRLAGLVARDGAQRIMLDVLARDEAKQLLRATIGAQRTDEDPDATADLAERCGWHPLALRVAAERVAADRSPIAVTVAQLANREDRLNVLAAPGDEESTVRSVFAWSRDRLSTAAAHLFQLLGLHDGPDLTVPAMAALAGVTTDQLAEPLAELVTAHLLSQATPDRYGCHDLLQLYAADLVRTLSSDEQRQSARQRLAGWYLHSACAARVALSPSLPPMYPQAVDLPCPAMSFADATEALSWFEAERVNLLAVTRSARVHHLYHVGWQVPTAMYGFFDRRKYYADWLASHEIALDCARQLDDREAQGRILCNIGNAYRPLRRDEEAIECYRPALELFQEVGYQQGQAKVWGNIGSSYDALERFDDAFDAHRRSLDIFRDIGDRYGEALTLTNLGEIHQHVNQLPEAAERHRVALKLFRELGDEHGACRAMINLGVTMAGMGEDDAGLKLAQEALSGYRTAGDQFEEANVLAAMGEMHARAGRAEPATACRRAALHLYEQLGNATAATETAAKLSVR